ncbi:MAG TPA: N-acetylmuramoyl-L-alanine amidase [Rhizomicrobium sp.]|nr:N-acetylmuramoyl-L-alanine amidase [Rhizomicrobium sp.]
MILGRVVAGCLLVAALWVAAIPKADGADDAIGRLMHAQAPSAEEPAKNLPVAPPKPVPAAGAGPSVGTRPQGPLPIVMSARIGEHQDRTRLVIELSDPVNLRAFSLANPDRVVIDMPEVSWRLGAPPRPSGFGAVKSYRFGQFRGGNSRMVIDLNQPVSISDALVLPPSAGFGYRVVIDLFPTTRPKFDAQAGWPADLKKRESDAEKLAAMIAAQQAPAAGGKKVIVLDPGHGGLDAGTTGVNGLMEKDLALAEGLKLARLLRSRGYSVIMTRDNDTFIPLRQRVATARANRADLFIALHADSNPDPSITGTSIYTLNDGRSDREASALASRENQSDIIAGVDLSGENNPVAPILINLAQRDTRNRSSEFATNALKSLGQVTDLLARSPHRSASLAVLVAPDVPAVLIELGYLSNNGDAAQMNSDSWRGKTAQAIADAVDAQFARVPASPQASR